MIYMYIYTLYMHTSIICIYTYTQTKHLKMLASKEASLLGRRPLPPERQPREAPTKTAAPVPQRLSAH